MESKKIMLSASQDSKDCESQSESQSEIQSEIRIRENDTKEGTERKGNDIK